MMRLPYNSPVPSQTRSPSPLCLVKRKRLTSSGRRPVWGTQPIKAHRTIWAKRYFMKFKRYKSKLGSSFAEKTLGVLGESKLNVSQQHAARKANSFLAYMNRTRGSGIEGGDYLLHSALLRPHLATNRWLWGDLTAAHHYLWGGYQGVGARLLTLVHGGNTKGDRHKLKQEIFRQEKAISKSFFLMRTIKQWNRLLTEPVKFLFSEVFMLQLDRALSKLLGSKYEDAWAALHKGAKDCAKAGEVVDSEVVMLSAHWEKKRNSLVELQDQLQQIPGFLADLECLTASLGRNLRPSKLIFLLLQHSQDCVVNIYRILLIALEDGRVKQSSEHRRTNKCSLSQDAAGDVEDLRSIHVVEKKKVGGEAHSSSLEEVMEGTLTKIADDTELGGIRRRNEGRAAVQRDLERLEEWADRKIMTFLTGTNAKPCTQAGGAPAARPAGD
ncbi:hypothetical protein QYF61_026669 [Mycteria americana]|uniref:Dysbindin domain-containing protein 1 n=1 Tax=Mycteria americana TaxID=33587 RepID=A0AAN7NQ58_MYCAM|nr:hypothetical protein QYF61_026669 [Mycteria americana]